MKKDTIKTLEWCVISDKSQRDHPKILGFSCLTPVSTYTIVTPSEHHSKYRVKIESLTTGSRARFEDSDTEEESKTLCQRHFESLVLSCLN